jgi:L-histidine N-alpha-methyltransferase
MKAARAAVSEAKIASAPPSPRLRMDVVRRESAYATLADDIRAGLSHPQKWIPTKYLYDDRGSKLFDAICDLPEYYPTRTEHALLREVGDEVVGRTEPADVVEFGSGTSRKTRTLLDALQRTGAGVRYVPMDVNEWIVRRTSTLLLRDYADLRIHGIIGDYSRDLDRIPEGKNRLVLFLGSTIGNLTPKATAAFLAAVRARLNETDYLLLGVDLVKPIDVLEAAYNDSAGVTEAFSRNVLSVLNRELDADFDLERFAHIAYFNDNASQIEIFLESLEAQEVSFGKIDLRVRFAKGERIHTEISRKFTHAAVESALRETGYTLERWYTPANGYFGLALARAS